MARVHAGGAYPAPATTPVAPAGGPVPHPRTPPAVPGARVVLVRDSRWPPVPGVCCWRYAVREAFAAAGTAVAEAVWTAPDAPRPTRGVTRSTPRLPRLPRPVRWPLVRAYRGIGRGRRLLADRLRAARSHRHAAGQQLVLAPQLSGAALVVAESAEAAAAAIAAGVPGRRVWPLVLPVERPPAEPRAAAQPVADQASGGGRTRGYQAGDGLPGDHPAGDHPVGEPPAGEPPTEHPGAGGAGLAAERAVAGAVGGFLTGSEPDRESVERAVASYRVRVEVFPPLAPDRSCPACAPPTGPAQGPADLPGPRQLARWRAAAGQSAAGQPTGGQSPAVGPAGVRIPTPRAGWTPAPAVPPGPGSDRAPAPEGSAEAQVRAARTLLGTVTPDRPPHPRPARPTLVTGFDLKFVSELAGHLDDRADLEVTVDAWPGLSEPSARTERLAARAESVLAEWARPSAVWLSRRKRPGQVLVVRLHRYELDFPYPRDIAIDNVDAVVHVSPPIGHRIRDELGWPPEKLVHIPNFVPVGWLDRPKLPDARFGLGFVGMEWRNKRFDLALDLLAEVRRQDPRFALFVRSVLPWHNRYAWSRPEEREYAVWCFARIEQDPLLRGAVTFDPPGRDMARWYRRAGHVLSMSDVESFHMTVAEGMASGAVPVIRPWPGAAEIYDGEWIHSSVGDAAAAVLAAADPDVWAERAARAKAEIGRTADPAAVVRAWADLLHGDLDAARGHVAHLAPAGPRGPIPHQRPPGA